MLMHIEVDTSDFIDNALHWFGKKKNEDATNYYSKAFEINS